MGYYLQLAHCRYTRPDLNITACTLRDTCVRICTYIKPTLHEIPLGLMVCVFVKIIKNRNLGFEEMTQLSRMNAALTVDLSLVASIHTG